MSVLANKKLIIGVTGGIASYKVCDVIRSLKELGADVQVIMTESANKFVTPLTFESLSYNPVLTEMFAEDERVATRHIDIARDCDALLICPATANMIGNVTHGIADDLLSTIIMVAGAKKTILAPAMNTDMWNNPIVQKNVSTLKDLGYEFIEPEIGLLACRTEGIGKLAANERIVSKVKIKLLQTEEFKNKHFLITAGPTQEAIDPVRFLTNNSSGKMGFSLAEAALSGGAEVTLVSGPTSLNPPEDAVFKSIQTAEEMKIIINDIYPSSDVLIMSAAVSDYRPVAISSTKIKKNNKTLNIDLEKTTDILAELSTKKNNCVFVGFAVETDNIIANANEKMRKKNLDIIVVNNPLVEGAGFATDTNVVTILTQSGDEISLPKMNKFEIALHILDEVAILLGLRPSKFKSAIQV